MRPDMRDVVSYEDSADSDGYDVVLWHPDGGKLVVRTCRSSDEARLLVAHLRGTFRAWFE